MFPQGSQKKTNTVVVMIDGKAPKTVTTMDSPPEPMKPPKCRLTLVLPILLVVLLILLAGYSAWLFFDYETGPSKTHEVGSNDELFLYATDKPPLDLENNNKNSADELKTTTEGAVVNKDRTPSVGPVGTNYDRPTISRNDENRIKSEEDAVLPESPGSGSRTDDADFVFVSSGGSGESVYDSSAPRNSDDDYEYSSNGGRWWANNEWPQQPVMDGSSSSLGDTTWKEDQDLWRSDSSVGEFLSSIGSSYPFAVERGDTPWLPRYFRDRELSENAESSSDGVENWDKNIYGSSGEGLGSGDLIDAEFDSSYDGELFWLQDWLASMDSNVDTPPKPINQPAPVDSFPPQRIEIAVCEWPKKDFERQAATFLSMKIAFYTSPEYKVTGISTDSSSMTHIYNTDENGSAKSTLIYRDYSSSIFAVKTVDIFSSVCYFTDLTPDLSMDHDDEEDSEEVEGSGSSYYSNGLRDMTLEIQNPVLLGSSWRWSQSDNMLHASCSTSTKYWANKILIKE